MLQFWVASTVRNDGKSRMAQSYSHPKIFPKFFTMSYNREEKRKVPRTPEEIQEIEDRLAKLQADFRDIRTKMRDSNMPTVELATGTFTFLLDRMEPLAKKYLGQVGEQHAVMAAIRLREKKKAEIEARKKTGKK